MPKPLHDQPARDRFQTELDTNFCVSAGAGVGKTTAIVRRIAELARQRPEALGRLVVVTYTRAAAEELRVRARALLLGDSADSDFVARFRQAFFGTIHSFCLKLVREFGAELGVAPESDLIEGAEEDLLWARFCDGPKLDAVRLEREVLDQVTRFLSFDTILNLARIIDPSQAEKLIAAETPDPQPELDFHESLADGGGRSAKATQENQEMLRRFYAEFSEGAVFLLIPEFKGGSKTFHAAYQQEIAPLAAWLGRQAARIAARIALGFRDYRREQGLMNYADQIAWCRRLVDSPAVLEALRARDWIVLLDEAQDTDAAMFAILTEVARPPGAAVGEWPEQGAAPRDGHFCFVGDEQQSIFAGRSNLAVYRKYVEAFSAGLGGERLEFSVTMRCPVRVIGVVNAIFFEGSRLRQTHFAFRELHPKPDCTEGAAWLLPVAPLPGEKPKVAIAFREECRQVAEFLSKFGMPGLGVERWRDVAILCPRRDWLAVASEVFIEAGLPCRLISQKRLQIELPERSWSAALLHVLLNPWDRFELLGVLREIFAVSDVELADAQADNQPFTFWSARGLSPRLASALELLRGLHAAAPPAGSLSMAQYVSHVFDAAHLEARLAAIGQRRDAVRRLRHEALRAEIAGVPLRAWVAQLVRDLQRPAPEAASVEDEMPMLTCQKAKGQEWPVVIPLGLARSIIERPANYPQIEENADEITIHVANFTVDSEISAARHLSRREENQRLFYVTLTRAKSLLILPDSLRLYNSSRESFMDICQWAGLDCGSLFQQPSPSGGLDFAPLSGETGQR